MHADTYAATAGAYDLLAAPFLPDQLAALDLLIPHIDPAAGPVLDIGFGTGRLAEHLLDAVPELTVLGLEPSLAIRSLALGRLAMHPEWSQRVTVRPEGALQAPLPDRLGAVVMLGVVGHFPAFERVDLWRRLAARLDAGGTVLLDLQLPETPTEVPRHVFADTTYGALRYRGTAEGTPSGADTMTWRMTYQTLDGDALLVELVAEHRYHHAGPDVLRAELAEHGFTLQRIAATTFWLATRTA